MEQNHLQALAKLCKPVVGRLTNTECHTKQQII